MREITFRGYSKEWGWVYGDYQEPFGIYPPQICPRKSTADYDEFEGIAVIPETVGQYTGLTDCKGNKIFEGDIISVKYEYESYSGTSVFYEYYEVFFHEKYYCWYTRHSTIKTEYWLYGFNNRCEVIGNIYDNPELLGNSELFGADNDE